AVSHIEHVSLGFWFQLGPKHSLTATYGSNVFFGYKKFSNLFLQYDYSLPKLTVGKVTPKIGVRGGDSYFTDTYYRWHVINIIPILGGNYSLNNKVTLFLDGGVAISLLQEVERRKTGEIGVYKLYLPEIKMGFSYNIYE